MKIYLSGPFFNDEERAFILKCKKYIQKRYPNAEIFVPMEHFVPDGENLPNDEWAYQVFAIDFTALHNADLVFAAYHGHYSDSGTAWEIGLAFGRGIPVTLMIPYNCAGVDMSIMPIQSSNHIVQETYDDNFCSMMKKFYEQK